MKINKLFNKLIFIMDNNAFLYPKDCSENKTPLMDIIPDNKTYQSQNGIYYQSQPPEIIPIGSSDFPSYQNYNTNQNNNMNGVQKKESDYENFQINAQMKKYHIKQPLQNTFHISTGDKWLPLILLFAIILLILFVVLAVTGAIQIDGEGVLVIIFLLV